MTSSMAQAGSLSPAGLHRLHEAMVARVANGELPGMVILLAVDDEVYVDPIGTLAFDGGEPMRRETVFRIASMTKPILAAATMMLVEEGKLALSEPVDRLLPELADRRVLRHIDGPLDDTLPANRSITVDDLLTCRMGYGMLFSDDGKPPYPIAQAADDLQLVTGTPDPRTPHGPDEWMRRFGTLPLMAQPGEAWHYNVASIVLGVLVARAAGEPLGDFFKRRVFDPLGMTHTGFWLPADRIGALPSCYMTGFDEWRAAANATDWTKPPVFPSGAGNLLSTVDDYLAFARLLLNNGVHRGERLLSAESVALMTTDQLTPEQRASGGPVLDGNGWGFGMAVVREPTGAWSVPGRYGWAGGYGTTWFNDPHRRQVVIGMTQAADFLWAGASLEFDDLAARAAL